MLVTLITVVLFGCSYGNDDFRILDSIHDEQPCLEDGGICVIEADCPTGNLVKRKGLCPEQQSMGVECCYGISVKETRCEKRGGHCVPSSQCNPSLVTERATNCKENEKCCILV
ncbi:hypothetical protein K1T71_003558 [Dendrolimus kikuchii]|uniref:Uncharacterized protein n=1 Tax=Dendrolimus kikuchii TaxID=765133 RepID=A0ACC1DC08_9NEOP|nr:hypothetical protein K1T71_003558 [Dendrolimus kikuchii]